MPSELKALSFDVVIWMGLASQKAIHRVMAGHESLPTTRDMTYEISWRTTTDRGRRD